MIKKVLNEVSKFDFYFREADGDDGNDNVSVKVVPRENRGTDYNDDTTNVSVAPRTNRGTDYNNETDENTPDNDETEEPTDDTNTTDTDVETDTENNNENDTDVDTDDTNDDTVTEPDTGDDGTDYNDDDVDNTETDDNTEDNVDNNNDADRAKKYSLYLRYLKLYDMIDTFSEKIRTVVKDDSSQNAVINKVVDNLNDLHDGMYEYMTIKFMNASYMEAVIYFETVINCIRLNFELLRNNKINLKQ